MSALYLRENLTFDQARVQVLHEGKDGKDLYMKGIFVGVRVNGDRLYTLSVGCLYNAACYFTTVCN